MNELISLLEGDKLPDNFQDVVGNGAGDKGAVKRKREGGGAGGAAEPEGELLGVPPVNDIYRSRQQKRVHVA